MLLDFDLSFDGSDFTPAKVNTSLIGFTDGALTDFVIGHGDGVSDFTNSLTIGADDFYLLTFNGGPQFAGYSTTGATNVYIEDLSYALEVADVAEPGAIAVFGTALLGLGMRRRRVPLSMRR